MAAPILPSATFAETAFIDAVTAARPSTLQWFNAGGVWSRLPTMFRAQVLLNLSRLGDEVQAARLKTSTGPALRTLAASEFQCVLPPTPQTALASLLLVRPNANAGAGTIPSGTTFVKKANPLAVPLPIAAATYTTQQAVYMPESGPGSLSTTLRLVATAPGAAANLPSFSGYAGGGIIAPAQPLFDPTLLPFSADTSGLSCTSGGGSSGLPDPVLAAAAKAYAIGLFGPNAAAAVAGMYSTQSVRHFAFFPASAYTPFGQAFIADESWGSSPAWHAQVAQVLTDSWIGFGDRIHVGGVLNQQIAVASQVVLNSTDDLNDTSDIDANIRTAAESYFNDRPDWYRWRLGSLQAMIGAADSRIQRCSSVVVSDAISGNPLPEPLNVFGLTQIPWLVHYWLTDRNCNTTYLPPSS
jgi:hypothetical protein